MKRDRDAALAGRKAEEFKSRMLKDFRALKRRLARKGAKSQEGVVWVDGKPRSIGEDD